GLYNVTSPKHKSHKIPIMNRNECRARENSHYRWNPSRGRGVVAQFAFSDPLAWPPARGFFRSARQLPFLFPASDFDSDQPHFDGASVLLPKIACMRIRNLRQELWLPGSIEQHFAFFCNAQNLDAITPPWLHFRVLTPAAVKLGRGTLLDYRFRIRGIPVHW